MNRMEEELGSGQFSVVNRGKWDSKMGLRDVAIKTLKDDRSESCRVKLLQEAAIMGQFRHPNIVQIYGVVTMGEPVIHLLHNDYDSWWENLY